jgi:hypothetical protein
MPAPPETTRFERGQQFAFKSFSPSEIRLVRSRDRGFLPGEP